MAITQEVRDYADNLSDNEKADLERLSAEEGMKLMSDEFKKHGGEVYLPADEVSPAE
jgi:phosphomethylpyrimidine synthase